VKFVPVKGEVYPAAPPDLFILPGVFDKTLQGRYPARAANNAAVKANRHHARSLRTLGI
jgi:hypothetical protein